MPPRTIALLFEFATLNGGERSMLATIDWMRGNAADFEFVAIAPKHGRLAEELTHRRIPLVDWITHDDAGQRHSAQQLQDTLVQVVEYAKPDLLHANSLAMGRLTGQLNHRVGIRTAAHLRDIIKLSAAAVTDLNRNDRLMPVSNATRDFHAAQGIDAGRMSVVYNGVDLEKFQSRRPTDNWRDQSASLHSEGHLHLSSARNIAEDRQTDRFSKLISLGENRPKFIATIGQIGLRKGQDVLAAAAPVIVKHVPDVHFLLIGERSSRKQESVEFETAFHRAFNLAGLSERLHVLGYRDDVNLLLNEIDLLVHPAYQEPYGRVLLEASASGVAIVATNVGGTSEIITDGVTGLLVPPGDPMALAAAVIRILTDPVEAGRLRSSARQRAVEKFSIATAARNLSSVWDDVFRC